MAGPFFGMAVGARIKNAKVGQATKSISKSVSGGKTLSLTNIHGHKLRLKVVYTPFREVFVSK